MSISSFHFRLSAYLCDIVISQRMAVFVDLEDDEVEPPQQGSKPIWRPMLDIRSGVLQHDSTRSSWREKEHVKEAPGVEHVKHLDGGRNRLAEALSCYPWDCIKP